MKRQVFAHTGICHLRVEHTAGLLELLSGLELPELDLLPDGDRAAEWLRSGGVYVDGKRETRDRLLTGGQVVRLHTRGKRYPAACLGGWRSRIVAETADFLVFDKPSGLPTHATLDNCLENAIHVLGQEVGQTLYTTHRLDIPTAGLLLIAKAPAAQARLNKLFAKGLVEKIYYAVTAQAVPPGLYTHFINPETRVPREISQQPHHGWWECRLQVEETGSAGEMGLHWHRVRLLTGKTHQIRAQFSALGAPLRGDTQYGWPPDASHEFGLACHELAFRFGNQLHRFSRPLPLKEQT